MPHVVIDGEIDLGAYAQRFAHLHITNTRDVLRTEAVYVERAGRALLIQALAVEAGRTQRFYVRVSAQEHGAGVRIDPLSRPERSEGVKRIVAEIGADLLARSPGAKVRTTNLVLPSSADTPEGRGAR